MKIYVGHPTTSFDYINDLYQPLKASSLWEVHQFFLPHDRHLEPLNSKEIIINAEAFIAEVSYPSTGLGIELGWAEQARCNILCLAKQGTKLSSALKIITTAIVFYSDKKTMIEHIKQWIDNHAAY